MADALAPSAATRPPAPDQAHRTRIATDIASTLFVEAGAGSGKTTALVDRIVSLVAAGVELRGVAAITFTEKAGAELRDRLRTALERRSLAAGQTDVDRRLFAAALEQLDGAPIGTLHAFAQRLLQEHPIEAQLPPRIEVLDEVASGIAFDDWWQRVLDELLADPALERSLLLLSALSIGPDDLRALARAFDDNWDLVDERVAAEAAEPGDVRPAVQAALDHLDVVCARRAECTSPDDKLALRLGEFVTHAARLRALTDEVDVVEALAPGAWPKPPGHAVGRTGNKKYWMRSDIEDVRAQLSEAGERLAGVTGPVAQACARRIAAALRAHTLDAARERRRSGRLTFHDLLVMARVLLRDPVGGPAVRAHLHTRYTHLLLDEFQDTDPIQIELAVRIAAADPASAAAGEAPWDQVPVTPGQLFVVGDPKQSIYRFRRADISTFLAARRRYGADGGLVPLTANFRTAAPVIDWVNRVFDALMGEEPDVDTVVPSQPEYVALEAVRAPVGQGPPVSVIGRQPHAKGTRADRLRAAEAVDVAATIRRALDEGWSVLDRDGAPGTALERPCRLGDITVLVPARTSLPFLEDALARAGIAYRAESSSLVYATRAVRDLLLVLRAVDDPSDQLAIVSALRTPLFGCGDDDLFRFHQRGGRWSYVDAPPDSVPADDPVAEGLAYLGARHHERYWTSPSEMLARIAVDRRAFELGFADGRPRDLWRRLRFVVDQARAWCESTGGGLRGYLTWVAQQAAEGSRVTESILPETDDDAVRIMTIHASKGLEFPITIVSGMSTVPQARRPRAEVVFPTAGGVGYRFGSQVTTEEYEAWKPIDEQMGFDERVRLLYVACTRAADHLVVSVHRSDRSGPPARASARTNAELLVEGSGDLLDALPDAVEPVDPDDPTAGLAPPSATAPGAPATEPPPFDQWYAELTGALARAGRPGVVAATGLTDEGHADTGDELDGLRKQPRDLDLPPWLKGRYGTAVGRAVHGTLQTIDLATGQGLEAAVAAQCEAEAVTDRAGEVRSLVRAALRSPSVRGAAMAPHWREVYACAPVEGRLLEGYVDLLYRTLEGLVVLDYKTAATADPAELDRRVEGYRVQGASYALTVAETTGERVARVVFLFLTPTGAVERELSDLDASVEAVRRLVRAGAEVLVPDAADA